MKKSKLLSSRKFKYGGFATAVTIGFIVLVLVVNIIATLLLDRFPLSIDLTGGGVYELSSESLEIVNSVDDDINIHVLVEEQAFTDPSSRYSYQVSEVLKKYEQNNPRIQVSYIDLNSNPTFASQYADESLAAGDIIVESSQRLQKLAYLDLFNVTSADSSVTGTEQVSSRAEEAITGAIMYVTDANPMLATFVTGHDEANVDVFNDLLRKNGYNLGEVNTFTEEIDTNTQLLVIAAPNRDFTDSEIDKIDAFLSNGGNYGRQMVYLASASQPELPKLEAYLNEWGISVDSGAVIETDSSKTYLSPYITIQQYENSDYLYEGKEIPTSPIIMPNTRPLTALFEEDGNRSTSVILKTYDTAAVMPLDADSTWQPDSTASYNTVMIGQKSTDSEVPVSSTVAVFGSAEMFASGILDSSSMGDGTFAIDMVNTMTGKQNEFSVVPKDLSAATLSISESQALTIGIIFVAALPLAILIWGIVVFIRRRNL